LVLVVQVEQAPPVVQTVAILFSTPLRLTVAVVARA
jgi:hypothetical protein